MNPKITKISIVEDHEDIREFLITIFSECDDFVYQQAYKNAEEAVNFLPKSDVDIAIVDIGLPGESGIECVRKVKALRPDIQFMMYTVFDKDNNIFESLKAGANGYLLKSAVKEEIIGAVRELANGGAPMSPAIARKVTNFFFNTSGVNSKFKKLELLGSREKQVLELLSKGLLYKEIASEMGITIGTVKQHIHSIYKKLHVQNRTEAINMYLGRDV
ncbi:MAG: response regulator transcription factor [Bacteroidota bacterium]